MNILYQAVMILGRSLDEIDYFGWVCGQLGESHGPKCVNGVLTTVVGFDVPTYIIRVDGLPMEQPMRMAAVALVETIPSKIMDHVLLEAENSDDDPEKEQFLRALKDPTDNGSLDYLGRVLASINDAESYEGVEMVPLLDRRGAREWFSRAFDRLAQRLPDPVPADPPLTVQQIIDMPSRLPVTVA